MRHSVKSSLFSKEPFSCELELGFNKDLRLSQCALKPEILLLWLHLTFDPVNGLSGLQTALSSMSVTVEPPARDPSDVSAASVDLKATPSLVSFFPCACRVEVVDNYHLGCSHLCRPFTAC